MGGLYQPFDSYAIARAAHGVAQTIQGSRRLGLARKGQEQQKEDQDRRFGLARERQDQSNRAEQRSLEEERAMQEANALMLEQDQAPRQPMGPVGSPDVYGPPEQPVYGPPESPVARRAAEAVRTHPFTQRQPVFTPQEDAEFDALFQRAPSSVQERMLELRQEQEAKRINAQQSAQFQASLSRGVEMGWLDEGIAQTIAQDIESGDLTTGDAIGILRQEQQNYAARKGMEDTLGFLGTWLKGEIGADKKPEGMSVSEWGERVLRANVALHDYAADPSVGEVGETMDSISKILGGEDGPTPEERQKDQDAETGRRLRAALQLMGTEAGKARYGPDGKLIGSALTLDEAMALVERQYAESGGEPYGLQGPPTLVPGQREELQRQDAKGSAPKSMSKAVSRLPSEPTPEDAIRALEYADIPVTPENLRALGAAWNKKQRAPKKKNREGGLPRPPMPWEQALNGAAGG